MNQRADSGKENFHLIVAKPLIRLWGWLLSHTLCCSRAENRIEKALRDGNETSPRQVFALKSGEMPRQAWLAPPSAWADGFSGPFGFSRLGGSRPDAERPSRGDPRHRRRCLRFGRSEKHPATRRKLGHVSDHADRDAVDIGNLGAAQAKRIAGAGLLLLGSIGLSLRHQHRKRERG
jgi:hypothetical protein